MTYELHPLCTLFPRLNGAEFNALRDDIKANGLRSPIVLHDGMILDGGNRYRACIEAEVEPVFAEFEGGNLVSFVLSANLHRRHMKEGQSAAIVSSAADWAAAAKQGGTGANRHAGKEQTGKIATLQTVAQRAAESGASERTQRMADKVAKADPELAKQVAHGEVSLPKAVAQVEQKANPTRRATETASTVTPEQRAPGPVTTATAAPAVDDDDADAFGGDPVEMLTKANAEIDRLEAEVKAMSADDQKAETLKWRQAYDNAVRKQSEAMDRCVKYERELQRMGKTIQRIGKAIGEADPFKVAAAVEALVKAQKVEA